jgi:hypothetical protein
MFDFILDILGDFLLEPLFALLKFLLTTPVGLGMVLSGGLMALFILVWHWTLGVAIAVGIAPLVLVVLFFRSR